ncbi:shikimate dehydrogenase [Enterovirga sp.]|uniref:shikimate dehydrogenase n=1 Tax=Enterovirga sp. TaxID=2026350 RepID=UPI002633869E|nr:shikimate dehydrogenase [Enterovirga sp.]MDB5590203.1 shikimate 5-dehydrogenase [Enterovirga sp.]
MNAFVIGHPIAHSRSPLIHGHWLREHGIAGAYRRIDVPPGELADFVSGFARQGYVGGNVTVPHKEKAFELASRRTARAERLGAVNVLKALPGGEVWGDNTDGVGFADSIGEAIGPGWEREVSVAVVVGAGGAARAIVGALLDLGIPRVRIANRTPGRAADLVRFDPARVEPIGWDELPLAVEGADLLVNTTTLGMKGQPALDLALDRLPEGAVVADAVYVPLETPLLEAAKRRGLRTVGGLGMLLHQAVPAFESWFGVRPRVTPELRSLIEADVEAGR